MTVHSVVSRTSGGEAAAQIRDPVLQKEILSRCAAIFALDPGSRDGAARHAVRGTLGLSRVIDDTARIDDGTSHR